jgi:hypothetical protein
MVYIKDKAEIDMKSKKVVLARDGIYRYLGSELGIAGDNTIYNVKRTTQSVLKVADDVNDLGVLPITIEHPKSFLDLKNDNNFKKGGVGNCYSNVIDGINVVCGQIISMNDDVKDLLAKGQEVSLGSTAEITKVEAKDYDFEMDITGVNHLAIVSKGRCGNLCSITDGLTNKEILIEELLEMKKEESKEFALSDVEKMIDERMCKLEDAVKALSESIKATKVADEEVKEEEKSEQSDTQEDKTEEQSDVETQDSITEQLKQATADGLDKGKDIAIAHYTTALKFVDNGLIKAEELIDALPCEVIDAKLKEMFSLEEVAQEERNGLIAVALKSKKEYKDAWDFGKARKQEKPKQKKKVFSIFAK